MDGAGWLGQDLLVEVEIPRGGKVKRRVDGSVDYRSPIGAPFNYGCVPGEVGGDGDLLDAIVLGAPLAVGARVGVRVVGVVLFTDRGQVDDKLVCSASGAARARDRWVVEAFFLLLTPVRRALHRLRGEPTGTFVRGIVWARR